MCVPHWTTNCFKMLALFFLYLVLVQNTVMLLFFVLKGELLFVDDSFISLSV